MVNKEEMKALFDDMLKYNKDFDRAYYEDLYEKGFDVVPELRSWYAEHLPVDITTWYCANIPDPDLIYKDGLRKQVIFIRDDIMSQLFYRIESGDTSDNWNIDYDKFKAFKPNVISTHMSKSVRLPVMEIPLKNLGARIILRNNFYDWKVSVISDKDIICNFMDLFTEEEKGISPIFCEGFPKELVFGRYCDNKKNFTVSVRDDYLLFVFMYILADFLKKNK